MSPADETLSHRPAQPVYIRLKHVSLWLFFLSLLLPVWAETTLAGGVWGVHCYAGCFVLLFDHSDLFHWIGYVWLNSPNLLVLFIGIVVSKPTSWMALLLIPVSLSSVVLFGAILYWDGIPRLFPFGYWVWAISQLLLYTSMVIGLFTRKGYRLIRIHSPMVPIPVS